MARDRLAGVWLKTIIIGALWISMSAFSYAQETVSCELRLKTIQAEALSEENGDEVYFSISSYSNLGHPKEYRVPRFPKYWKFGEINALKNQILWKAELEKKETLKLFISVVEQDTPPWDVDDLIGTVQVDLRVVDGQLLSQWSIPDWDGQPRIEALPVGSPGSGMYILHGDNSRYQLHLDVVKIEGRH